MILILMISTLVGVVVIKNMDDGSQINASIDSIEEYFGVDYKYK